MQLARATFSAKFTPNSQKWCGKQEICPKRDAQPSKFIADSPPFGNKTGMRASARDAKRHGDIVPLWKNETPQRCRFTRNGARSPVRAVVDPAGALWTSGRSRSGRLAREC
jgi:hypothetical protein